jgi:hypothetical protein
MIAKKTTKGIINAYPFDVTSPRPDEVTGVLGDTTDHRPLRPKAKQPAKPVAPDKRSKQVTEEIGAT